MRKRPSQILEKSTWSEKKRRKTLLINLNKDFYPIPCFDFINPFTKIISNQIFNQISSYNFHHSIIILFVSNHFMLFLNELRLDGKNLSGQAVILIKLVMHWIFSNPYVYLFTKYIRANNKFFNFEFFIISFCVWECRQMYGSVM